MSLRVDERQETLAELDVYNKCLKLTDHTLSVCKVKENKTNNKHIVKRQLKLGYKLIDMAVEIGANILEANNIYVGKNTSKENRIKNYYARIELQDGAKRLTYRMEHTIRVLHFNRPFAESTINYWVDLLMETRNLLIKWKEKDVYTLNKIIQEI